MKKTLKIIGIATLAGLFLSSCGGFNYHNPVQSEYDRRLTELSNRYLEAGNEIAKQEIYDEYITYLMSFFEEHNNIEDWEGHIRNICMTGVPKQTDLVLTFEVYCVSSDYTGNTTFYCNYIVPEKEIETNSLYNKIKALKELDEVNFSGKILTGTDGNILFESLTMSKPELYLYIKNLDTK